MNIHAKDHCWRNQYKLQEIKSTIEKKYKLEHPKKGRDWHNYEKDFSKRITLAIKYPDPLIQETVSSIEMLI